MYNYSQLALKNGLRIVLCDMPDRQSVSVGIWVGVGGRYEDDALKGASHFLEHIVFKGSESYSCEQIKEQVEGRGGTLNAFTSEEQTCFYAKVPKKHLETTLDVLADMAFFPKIAAGDMAKEKTVIVEEIKMYHDLPQYFVMELLDSLVWPDHPLGKNLAGTPQSVTAMRPKDLKAFHRRCYTPLNTVIAVAGDCRPQRLKKLVNAKLGALSGGAALDFQKVDQVQAAPRFHFHKRAIEQTHIALGFPGVHEEHKDRYVLSLLSVLLGGNMSSRLFVEVREKRGLAYSISSSSKTLTDTGLFMIRAGVDNSKVAQTMEIVLKELNKLRRRLVPEGEFRRAKDYLLGQLLLGLEDTMEHMLWIGETEIATGKIRTLPGMVRAFEKITPEDIRRVARDIFRPAVGNLAVVGPVTDQQENDIRRLMT